MHPKRHLHAILPPAKDVETQPHELQISIPHRKDSDAVSEQQSKDESHTCLWCCGCCCLVWDILLCIFGQNI